MKAPKANKTGSNGWDGVSGSSTFSSRNWWGGGGVRSRSNWSFGCWQWAVGGVSGFNFSDSGDTGGDSGFMTFVFFTRSDGNNGGSNVSDSGVSVSG